MLRKLILILIVVGLLGCSDDEDLNSTVDKYIKSQTRFVLLDTFSVRLETVLIDSIATSSPGDLLVGRYVDPELGPVTSTAYFELGLPETISFGDEEVFDSLVFKLPYSDKVYGDTLQLQTISVKRLLEELDDDDMGLYNTSSFYYSDDPLGQISLYPRPNKNDEIEIRLSDDFGLDLFNSLQNKDLKLTDLSKFREYLYGIVLEGSSQNTAVLSFSADTSTCMIMYTHQSGLERTENERRFTLNTSYNYFNQIEADRTGTPLESIRTQREELASSLTGNKAFIQAGNGLVTRINFPSINRLLEFDTDNILYKAELVLRPYPGSEKAVDLPESLMMYYTDKYNNLISEYMNTSSEVIYSEMSFDEFYNEYNYYTIDLTQFLYTELSKGFIDEQVGLILTIPESEFKGSLSRLVIDARDGVNYRSVLNLYYVFYE
ncbi:DUF4270 family protein [Maribellus sp. YY47]|uniref:DUF4270 family protein n=1 Tax=Maribellus sp. YY47 TaxID=2929486 RepID=UPI002001AF0A|nr:DUF4270 family protein [Maribellus sp. YY47]MCK3684606.1 DUF4270 domain-containing protein [Maribellus sp. YY47]